MSALQITVTINASIENAEFVKLALANAGIPLNIELQKQPGDPLVFSMPASIQSVSILMHAIEKSPEAYSGQVKLYDGTTFQLDEAGRAQIKDRLWKAMSQTPQPTQQTLVPWWTYFIPEIRGVFKEIAGLVRWYPRAVGEAQYAVARNVIILIFVIIGAVGTLAYLGRVSGDAFVFVIGILLGYVFSFLQRYLGLSGGHE